MSCVAVLNADDASVDYKDLLKMAKERRILYKSMKDANLPVNLSSDCNKHLILSSKSKDIKQSTNTKANSSHEPNKSSTSSTRLNPAAGEFIPSFNLGAKEWIPYSMDTGYL